MDSSEFGTVFYLIELWEISQVIFLSISESKLRRDPGFRMESNAKTNFSQKSCFYKTRCGFLLVFGSLGNSFSGSGCPGKNMKVDAYSVINGS